ncbi:Solute carrier 35 member F2 [Clonorchis sinensis]|uniref:Solute carrier 35 member F2 n=1 Tax=Clonorchis sinensis TaxID=79923 RepID=A0A3R7D8C8_CLOSI|nr:Solute carrier 35 member F2 [Clonorchis sinensis]
MSKPTESSQYPQVANGLCDELTHFRIVASSNESESTKSDIHCSSSACLRTCKCTISRWHSIGIPLLLGQVLAGMIAATAVCSTFLANAGVSVPLSQNLFHYCFLFLCYFPARLFCLLRRRQSYQLDRNRKTPPTRFCTKDRLYRASLYIFAGLIDTHANWSFVAAYKFTSVTSIQLLDCLTIPVAVLLSIIFLRTRFFWTHYAAVIICLAGAGGMVATDVLVNPTGPQIPMNGSGNTTVPDESSSNVILGDFLVIVGSVAYAASNVLQQYLVIRYGFVDFLAFVSLAALVPTAIYSLTLERAALFSIFSGSASSNHALIFGCLAGYVAAMFSLYSLMPYVLAKTSAVLVNLSLLTADVYALLMGIYLFHYGFHVLYLLCFSVILFGVGLFSCRAPMTRQTHLSCLSCLSERSVCEVTVVQDVLGSKRTPI